MTENEYINVKHLGHIISAKECLKHITSQTSEIIPDDEFETVTSLISEWELKLFNEINKSSKKEDITIKVKEKTGVSITHDR